MRRIGGGAYGVVYERIVDIRTTYRAPWFAVPYVYVFSNPAMPGLYKIGSADDVEERRSLLSSYIAIPAQFVIEAVYASSEAEKLEKEVQSLLFKSRYNQYREFFRLDIHGIRHEIRKRLMIHSGSYLETTCNETVKIRDAWEKTDLISVRSSIIL